MSKVTLPAIDIDGSITGTKGKKCEVQLTEKQAATVQAKAEALSKGEVISDLEAYRQGYNRPTAPASQLAASSHRTLKNPIIKSAIEVYKQAFQRSMSPDQRDKLFDKQLHEVQADKAAPLWNVLFNLVGGKYEETNAPNNAIQVNFNLDNKKRNI